MPRRAMPACFGHSSRICPVDRGVLRDSRTQCITAALICPKVHCNQFFPVEHFRANIFFLPLLPLIGFQGVGGVPGFLFRPTCHPAVASARHIIMPSNPCLRLFLKVLAATSLRPTDLQGFSDPYCVCYLKIPDAIGSAGAGVPADDRFRGQRGETYFCEKTLNPKWSGQRFIFKVSRVDFFNK